MSNSCYSATTRGTFLGPPAFLGLSYIQASCLQSSGLSINFLQGDKGTSSTGLVSSQNLLNEGMRNPSIRNKGTANSELHGTRGIGHLRSNMASAVVRKG
jgi:hypothetical protein